MEAVRSAPCRTTDQVERFYFRAGALAFVIHLLRGVDFHAGNLIAAGPQPVFVDCESLLHPSSFLPSYARGEEGSILRTGLFPLKKDVPSFSAFGSGNPGKHCPRLGEHLIHTSEFVERLVAGFRALHQFVV